MSPTTKLDVFLALVAAVIAGGYLTASAMQRSQRRRDAEQRDAEQREWERESALTPEAAARERAERLHEVDEEVAAEEWWSTFSEAERTAIDAKRAAEIEAERAKRWWALSDAEREAERDGGYLTAQPRRQREAERSVKPPWQTLGADKRAALIAQAAARRQGKP